MIRILLDRAFDNEHHYIHAVGLSTDTKPTTGIITGSKFVAVDTGAGYLFDETAGEWNENPQFSEAVAAYLDEHPEALDQAAIEALFADQLDGIEEDVGGLKSAIDAVDDVLYTETDEIDYSILPQNVYSSHQFASSGNGDIEGTSSAAYKLSWFIIPNGSLKILASYQIENNQKYAFYSCASIESASSVNIIGTVQTITENTNIIIPAEAKIVVFNDNGTTVARRTTMPVIIASDPVERITKLEELLTKTVEVTKNRTGAVTPHYGFLDSKGNIGYYVSSGYKVLLFDLSDIEYLTIDFTVSCYYAFYCTNDITEMNQLTMLGAYTEHTYDPDGDNTVDIPTGAKAIVLNRTTEATLTMSGNQTAIGVSASFGQALLDCFKKVAWIDNEGMTAFNNLKQAAGITGTNLFENDKTGTVYDVAGITAVFDNSYNSPQYCQYIGKYGNSSYGVFQAALYHDGKIYQISDGGKIQIIDMGLMQKVTDITLPTGYGSDHFNSADWIVPGEKLITADGNSAYIYTITNPSAITVETITLGEGYSFQNVAYDAENKRLYCMQYEQVSTPRDKIGVYKFDLSGYVTSGTLSADLLESFQVTGRHLQDSCFFDGKIRNAIDRPTGPNTGAYSMFGVQSINPTAKTEAIVNVPMKTYYEAQSIFVVDDVDTPYIVMSYVVSYYTAYFYKIIL